MASVEEEAIKNKGVTTSMSELRIEGSSPTMVDFSDPCYYCGTKKRRCLHPPSGSRKKILVQSTPSSIGWSSFTSTAPAKTQNPSPPFSSSPSSSLGSLMRTFSEPIPLSHDAPSPVSQAAAHSFLPQDSGINTPMSPPFRVDGKYLTGGPGAPPGHSLVRTLSDQSSNFTGSTAVDSSGAPSPFSPAAVRSFLPRDSGIITPESPPFSVQGKFLTGGSDAPPDRPLIRTSSDQSSRSIESPAVISPDAPSLFSPGAGSPLLPRDFGIITPTSPPSAEKKYLTGGSDTPQDHSGGLDLDRSTSDVTMEPPENMIPFKKDDDVKQKDGAEEDDEGMAPEAGAGVREVKTTVKCMCGAVHEFVYRSIRSRRVLPAAKLRLQKTE